MEPSLAIYVAGKEFDGRIIVSNANLMVISLVSPTLCTMVAAISRYLSSFTLLIKLSTLKSMKVSYKSFEVSSLSFNRR